MALHIDGLVLAGMGVGRVPTSLVEALTELAAMKPVVLASRTGSGPVLRSTNGFPGSERDLIARGLIPAGFLNPIKARTLLLAAVACDADPTAIRETFAGGYAHREVRP